LRNGGNISNPLDAGFPVFYRSGYVQHGQFIGAFLLVKGGIPCRVSRVSQIRKMNALNHAPIFHIQARHDFDGFHKSSFIKGQLEQPGF
jgi:hypothetical protein